MAQKTDLYSILVSYANKNNSPYISIGPFLDFLKQYAKKLSENHPEWNKWTQDMSIKFWAELSALAEEERCELLTDTEDGRIYMTNYYPHMLNESYRNAEGCADIPFPNEESMKIMIPEGQIRRLSSEYDLVSYMANPQESNSPILKIIFPDEFGSALVLAKMFPRQIAETALLKVRNHLGRPGNKEYTLAKLIPQLQSRESTIKDHLGRILIQPMDCFRAMEDADEFTSLLWGHLCILIKNDVKKKQDPRHDDIAVFQAVCILEAINAHYKSLAAKKREMELAFKHLEELLAKPPYTYTLDQICKFTSPKGALLLSQYSKEDLEDWLKKKSTEREVNKLPDLLIIREEGDVQCFIKKDKMPAHCGRLLAVARVLIKDTISKQWHKLLSNYRRDASMESDEAFEKSLSRLIEKLCPPLGILLEDPKLPLVYSEMEQNLVSIPASSQIFRKGKMLPYSTLLLVQRRELLQEIQLLLPFWHSTPILTAIIAFFKNLTKRKKGKKSSASNSEGTDQGRPEEMDRATEIRAEAKELELAIIPDGYTLDLYMEELEKRWGRLLDKSSRTDLVEDVQALIRDYLRKNLKVHKKHKLSQEAVNQMAQNIVSRSPALSSLSGKSSLILYSELYILKLLKNIKSENIK